MKRIYTFLFKNTSTKQTVAKNTLWLFSGEFSMRLLKLFVFIYAARVLGAHEWGTFSYTLALMSLFGIISDIGMNAVLLRETAKNNGNNAEYISTGFFLKVILSILSGLGILSVLLFSPTDAIRVLIPITAFMLFLDSIREFGFAINRAFEKMEIEAIVKIITTSILALCGIIFISLHPTAISLSYAYAIAGVISVIIMFLSIRGHLSRLDSINTALILPILREGWPLAIVSILGVILTNINTIILEWYQTIAEIGIYSAAQKPIQIIFVLPALLSTALLPLFSRMADSGDEKMRSALGQVVTLSIAIALPVAIGSFFLGEPIILLLFGAEYTGAIVPFKIMALAIITAAPGMIMGNAIFAKGKQKRIIQVIAFSTTTNIILCLLLIPNLGIIGAAISITIAQLLGNAFLIITARKIPALRFTIRIKKILVACGAMALVALLLESRTHVALTLALACLTYIGSLIVLKEPLFYKIKNILKLSPDKKKLGTIGPDKSV